MRMRLEVIWKAGSRALRLASEPWRRLQNWHRLRAWRLAREAERAEMEAYFAGLEAERRDREREEKERERLRLAGMSKLDRTLREPWIKTPFGKI